MAPFLPSAPALSLPGASRSGRESPPVAGHLLEGKAELLGAASSEMSSGTGSCWLLIQLWELRVGAGYEPTASVPIRGLVQQPSEQKAPVVPAWAEV